MKVLPRAEVGLIDFCGLPTTILPQIFELGTSLAAVLGTGH